MRPGSCRILATKERRYRRNNLLRIGGENYHLPHLTLSFAGGAHSMLILERQVNDAPVACNHGLEAKRLMRLADPLGGHFCGKLQFVDM